MKVAQKEKKEGRRKMTLTNKGQKPRTLRQDKRDILQGPRDPNDKRLLQFLGSDFVFNSIHLQQVLLNDCNFTKWLYDKAFL